MNTATSHTASKAKIIPISERLINKMVHEQRFFCDVVGLVSNSLDDIDKRVSIELLQQAVERVYKLSCELALEKNNAIENAEARA